MIKPHHPIQPTPELQEAWLKQAQHIFPYGHKVDWMDYFTTLAVQWGADVQLEKALEWLDRNNQWARVDLDEMREGLRPTPVSKEQKALQAIDTAIQNGSLPPETAAVVREAFEQLGF